MADNELPKQPVIYDTQTRKPATLAPDELDNAIKSGAYSYKKGTKVNVLDDSGSSFSIDASELPSALNSGYKIETPTQQGVREYVNENKGLTGTAKVFLGQL